MLNSLNERQRRILLHGPFKDLADIVACAHVEGRKVLKANHIKVLPELHRIENDYVVIVEPDMGSDVQSLRSRGQEKSHA
jgi:hypothetical protein